MASFNRVVLVGNLTRDPELRYIPSGTAVTDVGLAVNDRVKRNGEWVDETTFVDITLWARTAEVASEYLSKGSSVLIEGRLKLDMWEKDGQKHSKLKVIGERMQMLGGKGSGGGGGGGGGGGNRGASRGNSGGGGGDYQRTAADSQQSSSQQSSSQQDDSYTPSEDDIPF